MLTHYYSNNMPEEENNQQQYEDFQATYLYCSNCRVSMPVRENLLLILPDGYLYEYVCIECGSVVGDKKVTLDNKDKYLFK